MLMKKEPRIFLLLLLLLLTALLLSSCAFRDIDKRAFIITIGIDEGEKKPYRVIIKVALPNPDIKAGENNFQIFSEEDAYVGEAVKRLSTKVEKQLDFSHMKMILLGENLVKKDVRQVLDWFFRKEEIQRVALVAAARPDAFTLMKIKPKGERIPSDFLFLAFEESGSLSPYIITTHLFDLYRRLYEQGLDPILPIIEKNDEKGMTIRKAYMMNKKKGMKELADEETEILNFLLFHKRETGYVVEKKDHFHINAGVKQTSVHLSTVEKGGKIKALIEIRLKGELEEIKETVSMDRISRYEADAEREIKERAEKLFHLLQSQKVDPLGLGLHYRAKHPLEKDWEKWKASYPTMPVEVKVKVKIFGTGGINR